MKDISGIVPVKYNSREADQKPKNKIVREDANPKVQTEKSIKPERIYLCRILILVLLKDLIP